MKKHTTIKDIAKLASVSPTAVSMALNHRPGVGEETRQRILALAREMNYLPNYFAQSLINKKSNSIGLIVTSISDPYYPELALGVEEICIERGYNTILCNTKRSLDLERQSLEMLRAKSVDGVILATVTKDDPNIQTLLDLEFPFVLVNRVITEPPAARKVNYVVMDSYSGAYEAGKHLWRLGHDRIGIIAGSTETSTGMERINGTVQALKDQGLNFDPDFLVECGYERDAAYRETMRLLNRNPAPSAFFAHDDNMVLGVREAILERGSRIPEDIALVGYDNIQTTALTGIDLSTITAKQYEMGTLGAKILLDIIENKQQNMINRIILETELIIRKSCGFQLRGYCR
jgi:LacI family transcriptional regulator